MAALQPGLAKTQPAFQVTKRITSRGSFNKHYVDTLCHPPPRIQSRQSRFFSSVSSSSSSASASSSLHDSMNQDDIDHMTLALEHARGGSGKTFPNPAVGCVLVRQDTNQVIGAGFHPRAGFPHAEVFALLEAAGHVESGVEAAQAVVDTYAIKKRETAQSATNQELFETVQWLTEQYASPGGPQSLFAPDLFLEDTPITAYVTLEPCCHTGKTPPCAASLVATGVVSRVVVGVRDPNPRVDGGGVQLLQDANVEVDMFLADNMDDDSDKKAAEIVEQGLAQIVAGFVKRITPRTVPPSTDDSDDDDNNNDFYSYMTGAMRRALRSHAMRKKTDKTLVQVDWNGASVDLDKDDSENLETKVQTLALDPSWMERIDHILWEQEVVSLRLTKAIKKKKGVKYLGERIAEELQAHVAQTVGHTVLLYRPGIPPVLDLATLGDTANNDQDDQQQ